MSNIFGPLYRKFGNMRYVLGSGALPAGAYSNMGLWYTDDGALLLSQQAITHYANGLPFDANGRVVVGGTPVGYVDQGVPFRISPPGLATSSSATAVYFDQGAGFNAAGGFTTST